VGTIIGALLPVVVTLVLGFFAAWHHDFGAAQASVLNRMVMLYALPMSLFASMVTTRRAELTSDLGLVAAIAGAMLAAQLVTTLTCRFVLHRGLGFSLWRAWPWGGRRCRSSACRCWGTCSGRRALSR
jgi:malonate transporter and related proteins